MVGRSVGQTVGCMVNQLDGWSEGRLDVRLVGSVGRSYVSSVGGSVGRPYGQIVCQAVVGSDGAQSGIGRKTCQSKCVTKLTEGDMPSKKPTQNSLEEQQMNAKQNQASATPIQHKCNTNVKPIQINLKPTRYLCQPIQTNATHTHTKVRNPMHMMADICTTCK